MASAEQSNRFGAGDGEQRTFERDPRIVGVQAHAAAALRDAIHAADFRGDAFPARRAVALQRANVGGLLCVPDALRLLG